MEPGRGRTPRWATARRRALRAAALRRLRTGVSLVTPPSEELAAAVARHHAALWRLAARAIEAYGGGGLNRRSCSPHGATTLACPERPLTRARRDE
eukprot:9486613-Alexandrium_andersonii.AAC.1